MPKDEAHYGNYQNVGQYGQYAHVQPGMPVNSVYQTQYQYGSQVPPQHLNQYASHVVQYPQNIANSGLQVQNAMAYHQTGYVN